MESSSGAQAHGPALVRLLARIGGVEPPAPAQAVSGRLGQWIDWRHAVALAAALDARTAAAAPPAPSDDDTVEFTRTRAMLVAAIEADRAFASADDAPSGGPVPDAAFFRQRCLALQQKMEAEVGHLRGRLRGRLMRRGGEAARLAAVDAVLERALGPRERALLAPIPELFERRFGRLQQGALADPEDGCDADPAGTGARSAWRAAFRHDLRQWLLAELELRLQPAQGLLAALRTTHAESDAP